jgi:hypothetical protein
MEVVEKRGVIAFGYRHTRDEVRTHCVDWVVIENYHTYWLLVTAA